MAYLNHFIHTDKTLGGSTVYCVELANGNTVDFDTLADAKEFIRDIQPGNW